MNYYMDIKLCLFILINCLVIILLVDLYVITLRSSIQKYSIPVCIHLPYHSNKALGNNSSEVKRFRYET